MNPLDRLVASERNKLVEHAVKTGAVAPDDFAGLDRLTRLSAETGHRRRWLLPSLAIGLGLLLTLLFSTGPPETDIDFDLTLSEFAFDLSRSQEILARQNATYLSANGIDSLEFSGETLASAPGSPCSLILTESPDASVATRAVTNAANNAGAKPGVKEAPRKSDSVTIAPFPLPKGTHLRLRRAGSDLSLSWSQTGREAQGLPDPIQVTVQTRLSASTTCGSEPKLIDLPSQTTLRLYITPNARLDFTTATPAFARNIEATGLSFFERDDRGGAAPRILSGLLGGTVFLNDLNARSLPLRPSDILEFTASSGQLRSLIGKPGEETFELRAHALVRGMRTGVGAGIRPRMPNWLEWAYAQESFTRIASAGLSLFGLAYSVLRWFKVVG